MKNNNLVKIIGLSAILMIVAFANTYAQISASPTASNLSQYSQPVSLTKQVRLLLEHDDFAGLEALATEARTSKARFADGEWKLFTYYQAVTWPLAGKSATDLDWEPHLAHLMRWYKAAPLSITAHVAYGGALIEYAWKARVQGQEWNAMGTEAGGKIFQSRLKAGLTVLADTKKVKERCPHLYQVMLSLGQVQGWSWAEFNLPYAQGISLEPDYHYYYQIKAFNMLPQNHGGQGEWENYADEVYQRLGPKEGALAYFMIIAYLRPSFSQNFFTQNRINWLRLKEGYQVLLTSYQGNNLRHNEMAYFASLARDQVVAKAAFDRIGVKRDASVWPYQAWFDQKRAWAYDMGNSASSVALPVTKAQKMQ